MADSTAPTAPARCGLEVPVLMKELRTRMRGRRAPVLLFVTTLVTITVGMLIVGLQWSNLAKPSEAIGSMAEIGNTLFIGLIVLQAVLCGLVTPALTAGAISLEGEQQTLEFLFLTRLSSVNILFGKLLSALSFVAMVVLCGLPVAAISFLLGGVDPARFCWALLLLLAIILVFGTIGLFCSVHFRKTATAVTLAYAIVLGWVFGMPFLTVTTARTTLGSQSPLYDLGAILLVGIVALLPTAILYLPLYAILRDRLRRWMLLLIWGGCTIAGSWGLITYDRQLFRQMNHNPGLLLLGNPGASFAYVLAGDDLHFPAPSSWIFRHPTLVNLMLLCLIAGVFFWLAVIKIQRVRENRAT